MRMTLHSDYALRMLIYLAVHPDRPVTVGDIAAAYRLSRNHLLKVALNLSKGGFVETIRGRSGGLRLAKPAAEITIGAVVRHLEEDFALVECLKAGGGACAISPLCRMKGLFSEALAAFLNVLDRHTIGEIVGKPDALAALFGGGGLAPPRISDTEIRTAAKHKTEA